MRTPQYYALPVQHQEYLRDVLVGIVTAGMPPEAHQAAMQNKQVFPRPSAAAGLQLQAANPNASVQQRTQAATMASDMRNRTGAIGPAEARLGRGEAMMSRYGGVG